MNQPSKPFNIDKRKVYEAYLQVRSNGGAAGVDGVTIEQFETDLKGNLYKIWNRMSSGAYFPPPVRAVSIPKKSGGQRILGVPTVADRVAQTVVKQLVEPELDAIFLADSYGYRPGKSALDAVGVTRERCWKYAWVLEFDIKGLFDNIDHELLLRAVRKHVTCAWALLTAIGPLLRAITHPWPATIGGSIKQPTEVPMLKFYFNGSPNPRKVALFLEETGTPYEPKPVDTRKGDQFNSDFLKINPNAKVPVIDDNGVVVRDSNAILLYLAEKSGKFLPANTPANRGELLSWLMFVATGVGPFSGQAVHFKHFAPEKVPYAHNRYQYEAMRHFAVLDAHLAKHHYMVGDTYTIVDMDVWGWARMIPFILGDDAWAKLPNVKRLHDEIMARPAAARAMALKDKFPFKTEMDDEARKHNFKHLVTSAT